MKFQIALFIALFLFPTAATPQSEITEHLKTVEAHLRARDVSDWSDAKQDARKTTLNNLRRYYERGTYPKNTNFPNARVPYFVDDSGINCAVAELMVNGGFDVEVKRIAATENNFWLYEMTSPDLERWTQAAGISVQEAAWIQPTYEYCSTTEFVDAPQTANCGDTIELSVRELDCVTTSYEWSLLRNEEPSTSKFPKDLTAQTYTIPNPTLDGERFTFKVVTNAEDYGAGETTHTIEVSCEGQDVAPLKKEKPAEDDMSGPDVGTTADVGPTSDTGRFFPDSGTTGAKTRAGCSSTESENKGWLIFGILFFVFARKRRR